MRKIIALLLAVSFIFSFTGCGEEKEVSFDVLDEKLASAVKRAEKADVNILFENGENHTENRMAVVLLAKAADGMFFGGLAKQGHE